MTVLATSRSGVSLAETLVALVLGLLVLHLALTAFVRLRTAQEQLTARSEMLVSVRLVRHVLRREMRSGVGGRDWVVTDDSLSLRAFRGSAITCRSAGPHPTEDLLVSYLGDRLPDPSKDSVLLIDVEGGTYAADLLLTASTDEPCGALPDRETMAWHLDRHVDGDVVLVRLFERGSYHLSASALRYRRGAGGRQPLTPEVFETPSSRFLSSGVAYHVELRPLDPAMVSSWSGYLFGAPTP